MQAMSFNFAFAQKKTQPVKIKAQARANEYVRYIS